MLSDTWIQTKKKIKGFVSKILRNLSNYPLSLMKNKCSIGYL